MSHPLDARIDELERELRRLRYQRGCDTKSAAQKVRWSDPKVRADAGARMRAVLAKPEVRERHLAALHQPVVHAKMVEHCRRLNKDPAVKAKRLATLKANTAARRANRDAPKQKRKRADASALAAVPRDPLEAALFGGGK